MQRFRQLDLTTRFAPRIPRIVTQCAVGLVSAVLAILLYSALDRITVGKGAPFALCFPMMLLATLLARWPAGAISALLGIGYAWTVTVPGMLGVRDDATAWVTLIFILLAVVLTIATAELFCRAVERATREREQQIADRDLLLQEIDHRMKNNFAIVASILDIQRRRADGEAADALGTALARVESIARAHRHLYRGVGQSDAVQMRGYLGDLCAALADALLLRGGITLACSSDEVEVPRDRAVSIGLVVNELVTNAAKHAFGGRAGGRITVGFRQRPGGWTLLVSDDGVGMPAAAAPAGLDHGLGSRLIPAFARQAGGTLTTESGREGTTVTMDLPA
ncbi:sensor histidine kinase [Sphingomonas sp. RIT328]|uniref:sensor histidine kinase n=1 Tax=Sphingomonas sp. RIT328 TaxID=1470591 RepID=UPI00044EF8EE|nr:sensor histidine kinase [Sphingomonas sp. RIT328]EZP54776.1 putative signal transduction histidine kinase [Sphingomonas sp. RIT328]